MSKPDFFIVSGTKQKRRPVYCFCGIRRKDGVNLLQAFTWNVRTCRLDVKGKLQAIHTARVKVPMRGTGAEHPVVVIISDESQK